MNLARLFFLLLLVVLPVACGSHAGVPPTRPGLNVLTAEEMQVGHYETLYHAVFALRTNWVRERPPSDYAGGPPELAQVFVDGAHRGDVNALRQIAVADVVSVRYLTITEAASMFGRMAQAGPAILVTWRRGP